MSETYLDCKGLNCPMPIVEIGRAFRGLEMGDCLRVEADAPAFLIDVEAWVRKMKQKIVSVEKGPTTVVIIEKIS